MWFSKKKKKEEVYTISEEEKAKRSFITKLASLKLYEGNPKPGNSPVEKAKNILKSKRDIATCVKVDICCICGNKLLHIDGYDNDNMYYRITYCDCNNKLKVFKSGYCDFSYTED